MEGNGLNKNERDNDRSVRLDRDTQINVVVNNADASEETINIGRIIQNFKAKKRIYVWVVLLCLAAGVCLGLLWFQVTKKPLEVSSVVTLNYDVPNVLFDPEQEVSPLNPLTVPVTDLTSPDGTALDLNQITSSHVLKEALDGLELSHPVTLANLRSNIRINKILTEDSRRQQEVAASMIQDKNNAAYTQVQEIMLTYNNQFVVSLTNGFGDEDSRVKYELTDSELRLILDRILAAYNDYLVNTYADLMLPDDEVSIIDTENLDILESLDLLRTAVTNLHDYCDAKPDAVKAYRSWRTGRSLTNLIASLDLARDVNVDYLYSFVYTNSIVKDRDTMIVNYQYQLRNAQAELDVINENIATTQTILDNYKNDQIFVSMQESDTTKSTQTTTDYYNNLIIQQAGNYESAAELETRIVDLQDKLDNLDANTAQQDIDEANAELANVVEVCKDNYDMIYAHMEEIINSPFYKTFASHTTSQGKTESFITASMKKVLIGAVAGLVIAFGLWFISALAPEFRNKKEKELPEKEVTEE